MCRTDALDECELESKKLSHDVARFHKEQQATAAGLQAMETRHDWILNQRQYVCLVRTLLAVAGPGLGRC